MTGFSERFDDCRQSGEWHVPILTPCCKCSGYLSAATLLRLNDRAMGYGLLGYVSLWLLVSLVTLWFGPYSGVWAVVIVVAALYRLQDLVFASLDNVFGLTKRGDKWRALPATAPVVINLLNIIQVIVIFALAYQNLPGGGSAAFRGPEQTNLSGPFGFLYLSWTTLFPPGSGYTPTTATTRSLVMAESTSGLLIIGLTLAVLVARMPSRNEQPTPTGTPSPVLPAHDGEAARRYIRDLTVIIAATLVAGVLGGFVGGILAGMTIFG